MFDRVVASAIKSAIHKSDCKIVTDGTIRVALEVKDMVAT